MQAQYPPLISRIQATFIDTLVIILLMSAFTSIPDHFEHAPDWVRIVLFASLFLYEPLCMSLFGATIGNLIRRLRVRKAADPSRSIHILQAIHDLVAGSVLIRV